MILFVSGKLWFYTLLQVEARFIMPLIAKKEEVLIYHMNCGGADVYNQAGHVTLEVSQNDCSRGAFDCFVFCGCLIFSPGRV
jgi:hypothetical protein